MEFKTVTTSDNHIIFSLNNDVVVTIPMSHFGIVDNANFKENNTLQILPSKRAILASDEMKIIFIDDVCDFYEKQMWKQSDKYTKIAIAIILLFIVITMLIPLPKIIVLLFLIPIILITFLMFQNLHKVKKVQFTKIVDHLIQ